MSKSTRRTRGTTKKGRQKLSDQLRSAIDGGAWSQSEIAQKIGIGRATMSRFVAGKSGLSLDTLDSLCDLLGLELVQRKER